MHNDREEFNISFDNRKAAIRRWIYDAWTTSQVVDSWMEKYPQWAHLGRKIFRDVARVSNPQSNKFSDEYRKIYERTLAHYREERQTLLEATAGKASSAISEIVERVRSNVTSAHIENVHDLLHLSRIINPLKSQFEKYICRVGTAHRLLIAPEGRKVCRNAKTPCI